MTRTDFLKSVGFGGAALLTLLTACSKTNVGRPVNLGPVDFTLDLTQPNLMALVKPNGFVIAYGVVVARSRLGSYVAATHTCSHEAREEVYFLNDEFFCSLHGARFDTSGKGLNNWASRGLTVYKTDLSGSNLRVFS